MSDYDTLAIVLYFNVCTEIQQEAKFAMSFVPTYSDN